MKFPSTTLPDASLPDRAVGVIVGTRIAPFELPLSSELWLEIVMPLRKFSMMMFCAAGVVPPMVLLADEMLMPSRLGISEIDAVADVVADLVALDHVAGGALVVATFWMLTPSKPLAAMTLIELRDQAADGVAGSVLDQDAVDQVGPGIHAPDRRIERRRCRRRCRSRC